MKERRWHSCTHSKCHIQFEMTQRIVSHDGTKQSTPGAIRAPNPPTLALLQHIAYYGCQELFLSYFKQAHLVHTVGTQSALTTQHKKFTVTQECRRNAG